MSDRPSVLFVCIHNAGRSQMAAAFARSIGGDRVTVRSGGSEPAAALHPAVVAAMAEVRLDLSGERPTRLTPEMARDADVVVTMGCGDACPVLPGRCYTDWALDDPAAMDLEGVRALRDEIEARVARLLVELGVAPA